MSRFCNCVRTTFLKVYLLRTRLERETHRTFLSIEYFFSINVIHSKYHILRSSWLTNYLMIFLIGFPINCRTIICYFFNCCVGSSVPYVRYPLRNKHLHKLKSLYFGIIWLLQSRFYGGHYFVIFLFWDKCCEYAVFCHSKH